MRCKHQSLRDPLTPSNQQGPAGGADDQEPGRGQPAPGHCRDPASLRAHQQPALGGRRVGARRAVRAGPLKNGPARRPTTPTHQEIRKKQYQAHVTDESMPARFLGTAIYNPVCVTWQRRSVQTTPFGSAFKSDDAQPAAMGPRQCPCGRPRMRSSCQHLVDHREKTRAVHALVRGSSTLGGQTRQINYPS